MTWPPTTEAGKQSALRHQHRIAECFRHVEAIIASNLEPAPPEPVTDEQRATLRAEKTAALAKLEAFGPTA